MSLKVLKTDDTERTQGLLMSDVINVKIDGNKALHQSVTVNLFVLVLGMIF